MMKTLFAPFRAFMRFPLVQFAAVTIVIFMLQAADDNSLLGKLFGGLDMLVDQTLRSASTIFTVKSFTKSWLTFGFMIAYVYLAFWAALSILGFIFRRLVDYAGRYNVLWSRNPIARSRGIAAYRAWLPLEKIRPDHIPQRDWEEKFAWPPNNRPPYPPLGQRFLRTSIIYACTLLLALAMLQLFTPFHVVDRIVGAIGYKL